MSEEPRDPPPPRIAIKSRDVVRIQPPARTMFVGNSLTVGPGGNPDTANSYPAQCMRRIGGGLTWSNLGVISQTTPQMASQAPTLVDAQFVSGRTNRVVVWEGTNHIYSGGASGYGAARSLRTYCEGRRSAGYKVIICTIMNLINGGYLNFDTIRSEANLIIRASWQDFADGIADMAARPELSDPLDGTYFSGDNIHLTIAGCTAAADVVYNALQRLP